MSPRPNRRRSRQRGYALMEALVAAAVASVGFVGAARMQTAGLKLNNSSDFRQKAVLLGYQMTDRIRANRTGFGDGNYDNPATGSVTCLSSASGCTPAQLAVADMTEWSADVGGQLPGGSGVVCIDSTPGDGTSAAPACDGIGSVLAVKLWWTDSVGAMQFVTLVRP